MNDPELHKTVAALIDYLDTPQMHLDAKTRRETLEDLLMKAAQAARYAADRKARAQNFLLYGSAVAMLFTIGPQLLQILKILVSE